MQSPRLWPRDVHSAFPGRRQVEAWAGEGAAFARYLTAAGPVFLKFLPFGWADERAYRRLRRETAFLRDLAPHMPVAHAPLLHAGADGRRFKAHLITRDLTGSTTGWGAFTTDAQKERALHDLLRLTARFHAFWHGPGQAHLRGDWAWSPEQMTRQASAITRSLTGAPAVRRAVRQANAHLPDLLRQANTPTLVHGDLHAGQVLWDARGRGVLIDYGQTHASIPGEDLAHVLAVRLAPVDRARLQGTLMDAYAQALAESGLPLTARDLQAQYRAGLAINLLSTARQANRTRSSGVREALENVLDAWNEAQ